MTREVAIKGLKAFRREFSGYEPNEEMFDMAIKALEQEAVLDKIRTEISEYGSIWVAYAITGKSDKDIEQLVSDVVSQAKKQVLEIIDKYKAEVRGE